MGAGFSTSLFRAQEKFRVLSVNTATKYIHLTGLPSLVADIDQPASGAVDIPLGEPVQTTLSKIVDKYAFMATQEGHVSYMGVCMSISSCSVSEVMPIFTLSYRVGRTNSLFSYHIESVDVSLLLSYIVIFFYKIVDITAAR